MTDLDTHEQAICAALRDHLVSALLAVYCAAQAGGDVGEALRAHGFGPQSAPAPTDDELATVARLADDGGEAALIELMGLGTTLLPRLAADLHMLLGKARDVQMAIEALIASRLPPVERTPEMVLRAMLRAYDAAVVAAETSVYQTSRPSLDAQLRWIRAKDEHANMRASLAVFLAEGALMPYLFERTDYEARLRGKRPLDAPPLEAT